MISHEEQQLEVMLTDYFAAEMPAEIKQLEQSDQHSSASVATTSPVKMVAHHREQTHARFTRMNLGLTIAACVLLFALFTLNFPTDTATTIVAPAPKEPVAFPPGKSPVEMRKPFRWVKKIEIDPETGEKTEYLIPEYDPRIQLLEDFDDEDETESKE